MGSQTRLVKVVCGREHGHTAGSELLCTPFRNPFILAFAQRCSLSWNFAGHPSVCYNTVMKVLFVAGYGPIITQTKESVAFYRDSLGLSFTEEADGYFHNEALRSGQASCHLAAFTSGSVLFRCERMAN